jgi:circadian clock protein KaiC
MPTLVGYRAKLPVPGMAALLENLILLRYREQRGVLRRVIAVIKTRDFAFDPAVRSFGIGSHGIEIKEGGPRRRL